MTSFLYVGSFYLSSPLEIIVDFSVFLQRIYLEKIPFKKIINFQIFLIIFFLFHFLLSSNNLEISSLIFTVKRSTILYVQDFNVFLHTYRIYLIIFLNVNIQKTMKTFPSFCFYSESHYN